jgi:alpha-D-ribose 1-methylphosphonate 5-triphosphate synthase subunit PhnG
MKSTSNLAGQAESDASARQRWMAVLARIPVERLESALGTLAESPRFEWLRRPEIGQVMVRARMGGDGRPFNFGEMTVTRCSVRLAGGAVGHAYVAGRKPRVAELAAVFDALLQDPVHRSRLETDLITPAAALQQQARQHRQAEIAGSKVTFFTMVRGED